VYEDLLRMLPKDCIVKVFSSFPKQLGDAAFYSQLPKGRCAVMLVDDAQSLLTNNKDAYDALVNLICILGHHCSVFQCYLIQLSRSVLYVMLTQPRSALAESQTVRSSSSSSRAGEVVFRHSHSRDFFGGGRGANSALGVLKNNSKGFLLFHPQSNGTLVQLQK